MENLLHVGLDVGSTTVKIIVMDDNKNTIKKYSLQSVRRFTKKIPI